MDRNAACPCGSGKRYKHCHGLLTEGRAAVAPAVAAGAWQGPVDFVIAGTQKGGTTALDLYLRRHPRVEMAIGKEVHFFDNDSHFATARVDYRAYHASFAPGAPIGMRGEATPMYMYWKPAMARMAQYNPALKVIVLLRDPIARAHSHWNMERQREVEALGFMDAVRDELQRARRAGPDRLGHRTYVHRGFYAQQLQRIWRHFSVGQTLVLRSEELLLAPAPALAKVAGFLGLEPFPDATPIVAHQRPYETEITPGERQYLREIFRPDVRQVEQLLGWD